MRLIYVLTILLLMAAVPVFSDSITVKGGYVRPTGDNDLLELSRRPTTLEKDMLDGLTGEVSYEHFLGDYVNVGANFAYYNSDMQLDELEFDLDDGTTARRDVELRVIPVEAVFHFLPVGRNRAISPYVGGGVGAYLWKYREQGVFFDPNDPNRLVVGLSTTDNTDWGWHVEGGVNVPVSDTVSVLAQAKYFRVEGDLGGTQDELDDLFERSQPKIDISQMTFTGGFAFRF